MGLYDECYDFALSAAPRKWYESLQFGPPTIRQHRTRVDKVQSAPQDDHHMDGSPCGGTAVLPHWVNATAVKKALHVSADAHFFTGDNGVGFTYDGTEPDLTPWYKTWATSTDLRVVIYNGDTDPGLNSFIGENWTAGLGLREKESWRPWTR